MKQYDVIVLGGGPAGMSSLIWCHSTGIEAILLERAEELGGQMLRMYHPITDYPGIVTENGRSLRDHFLSHLRQLSLRWRTGCELGRIDLGKKLIECDGEELRSRAIILATGASRRKLGIPGEDQFASLGVSFSATRDHSNYAGKEVCVIGGGDSAVENALILARVCPKVTLVHRSSNFRAREEWLRQARENPRIEFLEGYAPLAIEGAGRVERLRLRRAATGEELAIPASGVFIKIGIAPNTSEFSGQIELDSDGYIVTDSRQRTSLQMVYAAGDACRPACLSVATAAGHGAIAAKDIALALNSRG